MDLLNYRMFSLTFSAHIIEYMILEFFDSPNYTFLIKRQIYEMVNLTKSYSVCNEIPFWFKPFTCENMHSLGNDILSENTSYTKSTDNKNDDFSFIAGITNVIFVVVVELVLKELHYITKFML